MTKKVVTPDTLREVAGKGSAVNPKHEGPLRRPTEIKKLDGFSPNTGKTPEDFRREKIQREREKRMAGASGSERGN